MDILVDIFRVIYCTLLFGGVFVLILAFGFAVGGN